MPTYEYQCVKCKKNFELFQSMKDAPLTTCPQELCRQKKWGRGNVQRLLGRGAGVIFKGSGFYITDYRSEGYKAAQKKEAPATGASSEKSADPKKTASAPASTDKPKPAAPKDSKKD
jgi:putative FmdB family regulatory protein